MVEFCKRITHSVWFGRMIVSLIAISGLLAGIETYPQFAEGTPAGYLLEVLQAIILTIFVIEIIMKIIACGSRPWQFFQQPWNVFDVVIVAVCLLPFDMQSASVVRMARILRAMRMITTLPRLRLLVSALLRSIPSLGYIGILLGLHFYIYSVIGTITFGQNDPIRFGRLHSTANTLFQVLTLEGWNDVRDTQMLGSDVTYDDAWKQLTEGKRVSTPQPIATAIYFMTFIVLGTMIMLNLFTGVIISSMEEAQQESVGSRQSELAQRGFLTLHDELSLVNAQMNEIMKQMARLQERAAEIMPPSAPAPAKPRDDSEESY